MGKEKKRKVPLKQKNFICISHIMRQRHHTEIPDVERTWFEHMSDLRGYVTFIKQHSIFFLFFFDRKNNIQFKVHPLVAKHFLHH